MKYTVNITTSEDDLYRFETRDDVLDLIKGFDGLELSYFPCEEQSIVVPQDVIGLHMGFFYTFTDFWNGDIDAALQNFVTLEDLHAFYGGDTRDAIVSRFKRDIAKAREFGAEYLVFHVSDAWIEESFTRKHHLSSKEVAKAAIEIVNEVFDGEDADDLLFLMENLWQPGLNFIEPGIPEMLLEGIEHERSGFMLDTGHLLHTSLDLHSQEEGVAYIHSVLDKISPEVIERIKGIHLNQSITTDYMRAMMEWAPTMGSTYRERNWQMFTHVFRVDMHQPFTAAGVREMVDRIDPDYVTSEFITDNNETHRRFLAAQRAALGI